MLPGRVGNPRMDAAEEDEDSLDHRESRKMGRSCSQPGNMSCAGRNLGSTTRKLDATYVEEICRAHLKGII
jgi:hypothetical protein